MAHVDLRDNRIFIVFDGGGRVRTSVTVNPQNPGDLQQAVINAIESAYDNPVTTTGAQLTDAQYAELEAMEGRIGAEASRLQGILNPVPAEAPAQPQAPRETAPRETRPRERPRQTRPTEEAPPPREQPRAPEVPPAPQLPVISEEWIGTQLQNATGRDSRGRSTDHAAAARTLHESREFTARFLAEEANSTAATIAVFNALNEIPRFRLYLSSQVISETGTIRPEFEALQNHLAEHGGLEGAPQEIIRAANIYIRYFLLQFSAEVDVAYRAELGQLPGCAELLESFGIARTYINPLAPGGEVVSEDLKTARIMFQCRDSMDADTLTAAALYIRRWSLTHPQRGRAIGLDEVAAWTAPPVIRLPAQTEQAAPATAEGELQQFAAEHWTSLTDAICNSVIGKEPAAMVLLMRDVPAGQTLEGALAALERTDLADAFDRVFNDYLHSDGEFLAFLRSNSSYRNLAAATFMLSAESRDADRRLAIRAVQEFLNARAAADTNIGQDLLVLYRDVLGKTNTGLTVNGTLDMQTMAALAVYAWRMANSTADIGAWAAQFGVAPRPAAQQEQRRPIRFEL